MTEVLILISFSFYSWIAFSGIFGAINLFTYKKGNPLANKLLAFGILDLSLYIFLNGLTYVHNFYLTLPHLFRVGIFTQYLTAPFFYLYIKKTLAKENTLNKSEWLHFLPATLHFLEFIPFYLIPKEEKITYLKHLFQHVELLSLQKEGLLPAGIHPIIKTTIGISYVVSQSILLYNYSKNKNNQKINKITWQWIVQLTIMYGLLYFAFAVFYSKIDLLLYSTISFGVLQSFCIIYLIFKKEILDNDIETDHEITIEKKTRKFEISQIKTNEYKKKIENHLTQNKPYLIKKYSLNKFAKDCDIPAHHMSIIINQEYKTSYSDFINSYRIKFVIENRFEENCKTLSLEGLAYEAGFNSRNTFITSFKKHTGKNPSEYFSKKTN